MKKYCPICEDGELEFVAELYRCQRCGEELKAPNKPAEAELIKLMEIQNNRIEILKMSQEHRDRSAAVKHMLELTAFLRKIMALGLLRGSERLRDEALALLDGEPSQSDVSVSEDVLTDIKSSHSVKSDDCGNIQISDLKTVVEHLQNRLSEWQGVARQLADELTEANSRRFPVSWEDASESSPAWIAYRNLVDIEDTEANGAKQ